MTVIGIDEAGRGPVAGPVAVAAVRLSVPLSLEEEPFAFLKAPNGFKDSKKLTEKRREEIFEALRKRAGVMAETVLVPARVIDREGIARALMCGVEEVLRKMDAGEEDEVLLDGNLRAPEAFRQRTLVKGDERVLEIALASVCAKVTRDRYMKALDTQYPAYGFARHKGYGTKAHRIAIREHGLTAEHRGSFCATFLCRIQESNATPVS